LLNFWKNFAVKSICDEEPDIACYAAKNGNADDRNDGQTTSLRANSPFQASRNLLETPSLVCGAGSDGAASLDVALSQATGK
jgi:hypothetical protein